MLGNSFTYYHHMPDLLAELTGAEVHYHTHGGAHLREHLNPETELGALTLPALEDQTWDYVVLQEYSNGPLLEKEDFFHSVKVLCQMSRAAGAVPLLYATWPYQKGGVKMAEMEKTMGRMINYLNQVKPKSPEEIVDEMLAIMEDRDRWVRKKSAEYYNRKYNELLYYGLGTDESEE